MDKKNIGIIKLGIKASRQREMRGMGLKIY